MSSEVVRTHYSAAANAFYWFIRGAVAFLAKVLFRHKIDGKVIAESLASLAVPYPKEYTDLLQDRQRLKRVKSGSRT